MASGAARVVRGSVIGTGAALNVDVPGFEPGKVKLINRTDGSFAEWTSAMPDASMQKQKAGTTTFVTTNGITPRAAGFTLGADTDLNADGDTIYWEASE